jgi:cytochrome c oxidase subunit 1/cytochrome c oxidase subunit I+III
MPRRIYTYPPDTGWDTLNLVTTVGAFILAVGILLLLINVVKTLTSGVKAADNPWDAPTLEWATASPPPPYNFAVIPIVASRHPLWEDRLADTRGRSSLERGLVLEEGKETIATSALDGEPDLILKMPHDSFTPFLLTLAMSLGFCGLLMHWWWVAAASGVVVLLMILVWLWPERKLGQRAGAEA